MSSQELNTTTFIRRREFVMNNLDRGQAAFTRASLAFYDLLILRGVCRWIWHCPNECILAEYRRHLTDNHLEVGVGTGYFLGHVQFPDRATRVALLDLNAHCLTRTARRVSLALSYVVHCLPVDWPQKADVFKHLKPLLNLGGTLFGATLIQDSAPPHSVAANLMQWFNAKGTLNNLSDTQERLLEGVQKHFRDARVELAGHVAIFSGRA